MEAGWRGPWQARCACADQCGLFEVGCVYSLPGAAFDAKRVPEALTSSGVRDDARAGCERRCRAQGDGGVCELSETADASLIYIGGHGAQHKRIVYWMMGDFPAQDAKWLPTHAISLDEIGRAGHARDLNLVLYASCRDDPFLGK